MSSSHSHSIAPRMRDCLERQLAWFKSVKGELSNISDILNSAELSEEQLDKLLDRLNGTGQDSLVLEQEFVALKHEWDDAESISPEDREEIHGLRTEAQALSAELSTLYTQNSVLATQHAELKQKELGTTQRQRASLHKYRSDDDDSMSSFDRKA